jgi:hypothetical protein
MRLRPMWPMYGTYIATLLGLALMIEYHFPTFIIVATTLKCGCKMKFPDCSIAKPLYFKSELPQENHLLEIFICCYSFAFSTCITKQAFLDCHVVVIEVMDTLV